MVADVGWPQLTYEDRTWVPDPANRGPRADRTLGRYRSAVPPRIEHAGPRLSPATTALCEHVRRAAHDLQDQTRADRATADLAALTGALLRSESVASSKIERLSARQADVALAAFGATPRTGGRRAAENARAVAANISAMTRAIARVGPRQPITLDDVLAVHHELLKDDPLESRDAGRLRGVQNWIGGSDYSPRGALFVPPAPGLVGAAMDDLVSFAGRTDLDPVAGAAIAHAQFETIHPFTDGNGRTGRALVHLIWRSTQVAPRAVVPVSTALLADVDAYFHGLSIYRDGDVDGWVAQFADAALRAADAARTLAAAIESLHVRWREQAGRPRAGSAATAILRGALSTPVLDVDTVAAQVPVVRTSLYRALDALVEAGVLVEVTEFRRNRVWYAPDLFELLERFESSLGRRARPTAEALLP